MKENYNPPYKLTDKILNYVSDIMKKIGEVNYFESINRFPELRRKTRIKSIHSSLAIENNQLSLFQVEDVINGKSVVGDKQDIQEVKNAYKAYEQIGKINPYSENDLKKIQGIITNGIEKDSGKYRNHGEAVYDGNVQIFMAPPHNMVPTLMANLFDWMNKNKNKVNPLILSSVFHYEFVFIHPFSDGNGRTARLWQTAILADWEKAFTYLPIESMIKKNQDEYYKSIEDCNNNGNSTEFIEFMLKIISDTIDEMKKETNINEKIELDFSKNEEKVYNCIKMNTIIGAKDIIEKTGLSDSTVRRILKKFIDEKKIEATEDNETSPTKKYKLTE